ncbi:3'(2'),5'-bisphosphate nucleotidase CysQ [Candidatus Pacearchaeota archaeon]|nr:3'(2'),5'-bisphosphate nucleotidase CysQ [Candidatus Pacearchaeota archaeon]
MFLFYCYEVITIKYSEELNTAISLAKKAGRKILKYYHAINAIKYKEDESPVTQADLAADNIIVNGLKTQFPSYGILSEESLKETDKKYLWVIDPLDGTKEFINKKGEFTVNIALTQNENPVLGVIYLPVKNEIYFAIKNNGAYYDDKKINVSDKKKISEMTLVKSRSHSDKRINLIEKDFKKVIKKGSSLKGCMIARGDADAYIRITPINIWDICAMDLIVCEAGGILTDLNGKRISPRDRLINGCIVSNNTIHDKILQRVKEID